MIDLFKVVCSDPCGPLYMFHVTALDTVNVNLPEEMYNSAVKSTVRLEFWVPVLHTLKSTQRY